MAKVFLSYRRDDSGYVVGMLSARLENEFGPKSVYVDVDNVPLGIDFRKHLSNALSQCDVFLAIIGDDWVGPGAQRKIDNPADLVRIEIETALRREIPIVPVLTGRAQMPLESELPDTLRDLAFRQAAEVRSGRDLNHHIDELIRGLRPHLVPGVAAGTVSGTGAAGPVAQAFDKAKQSNGSLSSKYVVAAVAALIVAFGIYAMSRSPSTDPCAGPEPPIRCLPEK